MSTTMNDRPPTNNRTPAQARPASRGLSRSRFRQRLPWWILAALTAVVAAIWVYPFVWTMAASVKDQLDVFSHSLDLLPIHWRLDNYQRAWTDANFRTYLLNTVVVTLGVVLITVVRTAMAGYVLARFAFRGRKVVLGVLVVTLFVPTGYTIIPVVAIAGQLHLLNSLSGMVLAMSGSAHVAEILLYLGYFRGIPKELEEAALIDGAGFFQMFFRVMLPLANPITATVVLLTFLSTWNAFFLPLVFTFSRPDLRTLSVGMLAFVGENSVDWSGMCAAAVISLAPVMLLFVLLQKYFVEGLSGAVKS
ncbi:MAG: carbohydrate ABC transporter permease [Nakamurella sp.]